MGRQPNFRPFDHGKRDTRVLLAIVAIAERHGDLTFASIRREAGYKSQETVHGALQRLRRAGLVSFTLNEKGTIRPQVRRVPCRMA